MLQAGMYLNSNRLTLSFVSESVSLSLRLICVMTWLRSTWLYSRCGREAVRVGKGPS